MPDAEENVEDITGAEKPRRGRGRPRKLVADGGATSASARKTAAKPAVTPGEAESAEAVVPKKRGRKPKKIANEQEQETNLSCPSPPRKISKKTPGTAATDPENIISTSARESSTSENTEDSLPCSLYTFVKGTEECPSGRPPAQSQKNDASKKNQKAPVQENKLSNVLRLKLRMPEVVDDSFMSSGQDSTAKNSNGSCSTNTSSSRGQYAESRSKKQQQTVEGQDQHSLTGAIPKKQQSIQSVGKRKSTCSRKGKNPISSTNQTPDNALVQNIVPRNAVSAAEPSVKKKYALRCALGLEKGISRDCWKAAIAADVKKLAYEARGIKKNPKDIDANLKVVYKVPSLEKDGFDFFERKVILEPENLRNDVIYIKVKKVKQKVDFTKLKITGKQIQHALHFIDRKVHEQLMQMYQLERYLQKDARLAEKAENWKLLIKIKASIRDIRKIYEDTLEEIDSMVSNIRPIKYREIDNSQDAYCTYIESPEDFYELCA